MGKQEIPIISNASLEPGFASLFVADDSFTDGESDEGESSFLDTMIFPI